MSYEVIAELTNEARSAFVSMLTTGVPAIEIVEFAVGGGGYDPSDPRTAIPPDPTATELIDEIFRDTPDSIEWRSAFCPVFVCRLEQGEAIGSLGELGLFAVYLSGPNTGEKFLFGIGHMPMTPRTPEDVNVFRVPVPFGG